MSVNRPHTSSPCWLIVKLQSPLPPMTNLGHLCAGAPSPQRLPHSAGTSFLPCDLGVTGRGSFFGVPTEIVMEVRTMNTWVGDGHLLSCLGSQAAQVGGLAGST